jgi:hypothetical protein
VLHYDEAYKFNKEYSINTLLADAMKKADTDFEKLSEAIESTKGMMGRSSVFNLRPRTTTAWRWTQ